jgi:hypothetical protein
MNKQDYIDGIFRKTLESLLPYERELNDKEIYQNYPNIKSFMLDYNTGKINLKFSIKIDGIRVEHIGKSGSGLNLVFKPISDSENKKVTKLKRIVKSLNSPIFSVKINTFNELNETLSKFSKEKFQRRSYTYSNLKLTKHQKDEIQLLIGKEGGPNSLIVELLLNLNEFNKEYIVAVLYYIPEIRSIGTNNLDELFFRYDIKLDWSLIKNKSNLYKI